MDTKADVIQPMSVASPPKISGAGNMEGGGLHLSTSPLSSPNMRPMKIARSVNPHIGLDITCTPMAKPTKYHTT